MTAWRVVCRIVECKRNYLLNLQKAIDIAAAAEIAVLEGKQTHTEQMKKWISTL